jgi:HK97 family phage major capsid protein/HK97 family phage prohead protease
MKDAARRALEWRREYGRGGTAVGVARARDIVNGKDLSEETVKRMFSFFSRHENNKAKHYSAKEADGGPTAWRIAWDLWGGNSGFSFSRQIVQKLEKDRAVQTDEKDDMLPEATEGAEMSEQRAEPDELSVGDYVEWNSSGGEAYGQIERIERDGQIDVPDSDFTINGDAEDPAALIEVYREGEDGYEASGRMVGHRFSTLRKVAKRGYKDEDRFSREDMKTRAMDGSADIIDMDKRTVRIAVSSEEPVERSFGAEILDHSEASIDLDFARSGRMPLLLDHDPRQQIGVVENVDLDGSTRRLRATVRFGKNGLAKEVFDDVADGIRSNISVGYAVNKMDREGSDSYRVSSWSPMEVSVVSIPADRTVGVGRAAETSPAKPVTETPTMETTMTDEVKIDVEAVKAEAARAAAKETSEIYRLAAKHNQRQMADEAVKNGTSLAEFRGQILDVIGSKPLDDSDIGLSKKEVRNFSLMRAIRAMANPSDRGAQAAAEFEFEAAGEAAKRDGVDPQGLYIPADVRRSWSQRDLNTSDDSAMVAEDYRGGDFIDVLRNASSVMQAGATMLTGLVGDVKIPKKTAASTAGWISTEGGASSESEPTFGQVTMSPKSLGAFTDITRLMMMQSSLDIEALVRNDLSTGLALAIDNGGLQGSGSSGQPTGIANTSGINAPTDFAAANPTFAEVVAMETAVAEDNALMGNLAYILPAGMYGALKTTAKDSGSGQFVVEPGGTMNGYRAIVSNQVTAGDLYFGNFADLLIGMYGGLDITVDPYTASTSGTVRIVALQTVDVAVRHAVSFAYNNDGA